MITRYENRLPVFTWQAVIAKAAKETREQDAQDKQAAYAEHRKFMREQNPQLDYRREV